MKWHRICCICKTPVRSDGVNLGRSNKSKKVQWAHKDCICNMKDFVDKLRGDK